MTYRCVWCGRDDVPWSEGCADELELAVHDSEADDDHGLCAACWCELDAWCGVGMTTGERWREIADGDRAAVIRVLETVEAETRNVSNQEARRRRVSALRSAISELRHAAGIGLDAARAGGVTT